jgi:hypothetical protein
MGSSIYGRSFYWISRELSAAAGEPLSRMIVDILLDRGDGCSDQQMVEALSKSVPEGFDLAYTVQKVRQLSEDKSPEVRKAAREKLDQMAYSWPKIRTGWPESGAAASHQ